MNRNFGFSLIELMVVITIVGILAAVAVPTYKNYVVRSKISQAFSVMDKIATQMIEYHSKYGQFPQAAGIGLSTNAIQHIVDNPSSYGGSYIGAIHVFNGWRSPGGCLGGISVGILGNALGVTFANPSPDVTGVSNSLNPTIFLIEQNGVITKTCGLRTNGGSGDFVYVPANCQVDFGNTTTNGNIPSSANCTT